MSTGMLHETLVTAGMLYETLVTAWYITLLCSCSMVPGITQQLIRWYIRKCIGYRVVVASSMVLRSLRQG